MAGGRAVNATTRPFQGTPRLITIGRNGYAIANGRHAPRSGFTRLAKRVYLGKLTTEREGWQSYVIFIVRDSRRRFIFQCSTLLASL